jgi:hypothetical protein
MTLLLERAIDAVKQLPAEMQDAIAERLLAEFADEQAWAERFEATTDEQWDLLADSVRKSIAIKGTSSLDEVFPPLAAP